MKPLPADFELREVQELAFPMLAESIRAGHKRTILHVGTGGGKTIWAGMLFRRVFEKNPDARVIFCVPRINLAVQTLKVFHEFFGFECSVIQGDNMPDLNAPVQIATIQTLANRLSSDNEHVWKAFNKLQVDYVVADEAHLQFKGYEQIAEAYDPYMVGLTGTPFSPGMGLFWQDMIRPKKMVELIKDGTLCDYKVISCQPIDRAELKKSSTGEFKGADVTRETSKIIGDVYQSWHDSKDMQGRLFLGFCETIDSAVALSEHFNGQGANTAFVHSKMSSDDVQATLDAFKAGHYQGVFSVIMLIEGFDFPAVSALLDCCPRAESKHDPNIPNSCTRYVQMAGRLFRSHPDKGYALIHDHAQNFVRFGPYELIEDLFQVLSTEKKQEAKELTITQVKERAKLECSVCGLVYGGGICPDCGHEPKGITKAVGTSKIEFRNGQMVEIKNTKATHKNRVATMEDKIKFAQGLKSWCERKIQQDQVGDKPKKPFNASGFFAHKYKERFGVWPNDKRVNYEGLAPLDYVPLDVDNWIKSRRIAYWKSKK